jgi:hypothetical protein
MVLENTAASERLVLYCSINSPEPQIEWVKNILKLDITAAHRSQKMRILGTPAKKFCWRCEGGSFDGSRAGVLRQHVSEKW